MNNKMKAENLTIDLSADLVEKLYNAATSLGHIGKKGFDCDGSGMLDGYVMFDVYDIMLKAGSVNFDKRYSGGETIATFKSNGVYDKLCKQKSKYEGHNPECLKHKDLGEVHKGRNIKCSCHNPHYLGNFMPYPGGGSSNHRTKQRDGKAALQQLHNSCHDENPFRMLMDIRDYYEKPKERKNTQNRYIHAMHLADEDNRFRGVGFGNKVSDHGFYTQFKEFNHFVETLCFQDFVKSDYFTQGYELGNSPVYNDFKAQDYYEETMRCIKARTEKILKVPGIKRSLRTT